MRKFFLASLAFIICLGLVYAILVQTKEAGKLEKELEQQALLLHLKEVQRNAENAAFEIRSKRYEETLADQRAREKKLARTLEKNRDSLEFVIPVDALCLLRSYAGPCD